MSTRCSTSSNHPSVEQNLGCPTVLKPYKLDNLNNRQSITEVISRLWRSCSPPSIQTQWVSILMKQDKSFFVGSTCNTCMVSWRWHRNDSISIIDGPKITNVGQWRPLHKRDALFYLIKKITLMVSGIFSLLVWRTKPELQHYAHSPSPEKVLIFKKPDFCGQSDLSPMGKPQISD